MNLYFAPLEGIGGYIYRNAQADFFSKADKYFSPFIAPNQNRSFNSREKNDVTPEHNEGITLVPQIFTNNEKYMKKIRKVQRICDYREIVRSLFAEQEIQMSDFSGQE